MDKKIDLNQQLKERESKKYSKKADLKTKELATLTGCPKIDPLSRKMAEIITQSELASLGIKASAPAPKKQTFSIPNFTSPTAQESKKVKIFDEKPLHSPLDLKVDEPEPNPIAQFPDSKEKTPIPEMNTEENKQLDVEKPEPAASEEKVVEIKDHVIDNMEKIKAFQEELQREYPELALNEGNESSSFHTNELEEIVEACKDLSPEIENKEPENPQIEPVVRSPETKPKPPPINTDLASNNSDYGTFERQRLINPNMPSRIDHIPQRSSLTDKKNCELFDVCSILLKGKTEATTVTSRTPDIIRRQSLKLQESANKAQFLHFTTTPIGKYTPRCHINLNNCQSSPIFMSLRLPNDSVFKSDQGFATVDSLRKTLLRNFLQDDPVPQDFYTKNFEWLQKKEEKLEKTRENLKSTELEACTFDPYFEKHEKFRNENEKFEFRAIVIPSLLKSPTTLTEPSLPTETIQYTSLSPVNNEIRYPSGFNFSRFLLISKPMVHYQSINALT